MEGFLGFLGFSLGASLGIAAVRTLGGGVRPILREAIKAGLIVGETARSAGARAGQAVSGATADARDSLGDLHAEARAERAATRARETRSREPRKILIAKD
jgi:hypothetical protein